MSLLKIGELKNLHNHRIVIGEQYIGSPSYVYSDTIDTNVYNDITSNKSWMYQGTFKYDYLFCRKQIMMWTPSYVNKQGEVGWSGLTLEEKQIAAKNFAVGATERGEVYSNIELQEYWNDFVNKSQECRSSRWKLAKGYISYLLNPVDSTDLALATESFSKNYIEYGIESLAIDGVTGLYDWLENDFTLKSYYNETYKNNILLILQQGFY